MLVTFLAFQATGSSLVIESWFELFFKSTTDSYRL